MQFLTHQSESSSLWSWLQISNRHWEGKINHFRHLKGRGWTTFLPVGRAGVKTDCATGREGVKTLPYMCARVYITHKHYTESQFNKTSVYQLSSFTNTLHDVKNNNKKHTVHMHPYTQAPTTSCSHTPIHKTHTHTPEQHPPHTHTHIQTLPHTHIQTPPHTHIQRKGNWRDRSSRISSQTPAVSSRQPRCHRE